MPAPFHRNFYDGPSTGYAVGDVIQSWASDSLFGEVIKVTRGGYTVRVDPSCAHFRDTVSISNREAIRPEEMRVWRAHRALEAATHRLDRDAATLRAAVEAHADSLAGEREAAQELTNAWKAV